MSDVWKAPFTVLSVFLFAVGTLNAQSSSSLQTSVAGSDMAAASSVSNAFYRITGFYAGGEETLEITIE